jgi:sec-independent protein translocase protein TatB
VFGISLTEIAVIVVIALVVVGPDKLPKMLRTIGQWMTKLRRLTTEVRAQTGIDDILRNEGIEGGLSELRGMLRGDLSAVGRGYSPADDPYASVETDPTREYPPEGPDAYGALPDDLVDEEDLPFDPGPVPVAAAKNDPEPPA